MALLAVPFAVLGWVGVACGLGMAVTARTSPEGMAGFAAYVWLILVSPVAVLATALAAIALYARGSHRAATALGALTLGGVVWMCLLWLAA